VYFFFTPEAKSGLRAIDKTAALRILETLARFGWTGVGDIETMRGEWQGCFRLRAGEYRVVFRHAEGGLEIFTCGLQVFRPQTRVFGNTAEHSAAQFFVVVKGELTIRTPFAAQQFVETSLSLDSPANTVQSGKYATRISCASRHRRASTESQSCRP
jgi:mRNA-degrading endonuclease RelE of RelBE toxin-antitoxin system